MSKSLKNVKRFYAEELWPLNWVEDALNKWITVDEFQEITCKEYTE